MVTMTYTWLSLLLLGFRLFGLVLAFGWFVLVPVKHRVFRLTPSYGLQVTIILATVLLLFSQNLFSQHPWQGQGTEQNPFKINNLTDLENINNYENNYRAYTDKHFELTRDIEEPLMYELCGNFDGYFHGRGFSITLEFHNSFVNTHANIFIVTLNGTIDSLTLILNKFQVSLQRNPP
jgi:hypothetical protein